MRAQGTPADLLERFAGGMGGQSEILRRLTVQLAVPGEGWLVGEPAGPPAAAGRRAGPVDDPVQGRDPPAKRKPRLPG